MKTGLRPIDGRYYYFDPKTGAAKQGFIEFEVGMRYFYGGGTYAMATGWHTSPEGEKRYFDPKTGVMSKAKKKLTETGIISAKSMVLPKADG